MRPCFSASALRLSIPLPGKDNGRGTRTGAGGTESLRCYGVLRPLEAHLPGSVRLRLTAAGRAGVVPTPSRGPSFLHQSSVCCVHAQSCPTLCDPTHWSPPGSSVHGILQARVLEWVAISSSRASSLARDQTWVSCISCIGRQILSHCATWNDVVIQQALIKHLLYTTTLS